LRAETVLLMIRLAAMLVSMPAAVVLGISARPRSRAVAATYIVVFLAAEAAAVAARKAAPYEFLRSSALVLILFGVSRIWRPDVPPEPPARGPR
jgi:hypothetical protein